MGVNIKFYIVNGYKVSEEEFENLTEEQQDQLSNDDRFVHTNPMISSEGIYGDIVFKSKDGRYEDIEIPLINITNTVENVDRDSIINKIPNFLCTDGRKIQTYCFMCYS